MVKLSDALRGAADRAPLDGVSVDTARVARRAATQRGLRTGASGVVGAGLVAVFAVGIVGPGGWGSGTDEGTSAATADSVEGERDFAEESMDDAMGGDGAELPTASSLAWGLCGQELPAIPEIGAPMALAAALPSEEASGGTLDVTVTTTATGDGTFETFGLDGVILWDGIVVGTIDGAPGDGVAREATVLDLVAGEESVEELSVPLVNCWDGEPLPASKYELVLSQELYGLAVEEGPVEPGEMVEPVEPTVDPTTEGAAEDEPAVGVPEPVDPSDVQDTGGSADADASVSSDEAGQTSGSAPSEGAAGGGTSTIAAGGATYRVVAPSLGFVIPGDPVDEPFAAYLSPAPDPEPTADPSAQDGALDPSTARALYEGGLTGAWDMAAGTQRWLVSSDYTGELGYAWYGCAYDDDGAFPARSAEMDLLDVEVDAPASVSVSYGWVVDGNPELTAVVTNTSEWDLTSFWGASQLQLALVRDGRVVAEAYPVNPYQDAIAYAEDAAAIEREEAGIDMYVPDYGSLAAGESLESLFLWRDVSTCWTSTGQAELAPGTYTLLAMHYVPVGGGAVYYDEGWDGDVDTDEPDITLEEPADDNPFGESSRSSFDDLLGSDDAGVAVGGGAAGMTSDGADQTDAAIAVAPAYYDGIEFQVWTSLGEISVR